MPGFWGLDVQQMQRFENLLTESAGEIRAIVGELDGLTASVDWKGDDANEFKTRTWKAAAEQLNGVSSQLLAVAGNVKTQVNQQVQASRAG
jgi:hypothetical protein